VASLSGLIAQIWAKEVQSNNVLIARWPNATVGLKVTAGATPAFSAWTQILAAAKITNPAWFVGIGFSNTTTGGQKETWMVDVAQGGAGVELAYSNGTNTAQGIWEIAEEWQSSVGTSYVAPPFLPIPIRTIGAPRITAATAGLLVGGKDTFISVIFASGVGT